MIIKRERYLKQIRPYYDIDLIKVITGVRRCGKSKLLEQIEQEFLDNGFPEDHIIKVDFEDFEFKSIRTNEKLNKYIKSRIKDDNKYLIFLDEIQHVKHFEEVLVSFKATINCSIFVTGSNSKLLSSDLATLLVGRCIEFKILPFSFAEGYEYAKQYDINLDPDKFINNYIEWGGMPQRFEFKDERQIQSYLEQTYNAIIDKDIILRTDNFDKEKFLKISQYVMANVGNDFSANRIINYFKEKNNDQMSSYIVHSYLDKMEKACLINRVKRYNIAGKETLAYIEKQYTVDTGFSLINTNLINYGKARYLENIVYNELLSRGYSKVYVGKTYNSKVDFVVMDGRKKCFIQVAYTLSEEPKIIDEKKKKSEKTLIEREFGAFKPIRDGAPKYVMSLDRFDYSMDGISHINIVDFLLGIKDIVLY